MEKPNRKFTRFPVFVPKEVMEFAKKYNVELDIQELTLSAIAGYFTTFASLDPDSKLPYTRSHDIAKLIQEIKTPKPPFCPFCLMFYLDEVTKKSLAENCDHCSMLLNLRKELPTQSMSGNIFSGNSLSNKNTKH